MNAFLDRFHNFVLPLVRGEDRVCSCTCGRYQIHRIVPYHEAQSVVDSNINYFVSDIMTKQELDVIAGLLLGLCISWFLLWLDSVLHSGLRYWRAKRLNNVGFLSRLPKFSNSKDLLNQLRPKHTQLEDSRGNMVHVRRDAQHNINGSI
ncbi:transmembrane protein 240-like [Thunnus thynnus]|uniref:transmembrane protein 240-like n=1 Tax=Thunnus maccoyii TaxID=8240 RepID=UPI001C4D375E|nr:transmembrane protein 240-like [Thunnus maccoyii]XP_042262027.1 transmembrane protein 240-like [Thunnus maccoyii]